MPTHIEEPRTEPTEAHETVRKLIQSTESIRVPITAHSYTFKHRPSDTASIDEQDYARAVDFGSRASHPPPKHAMNSKSKKKKPQAKAPKLPDAAQENLHETRGKRTKKAENKEEGDDEDDEEPLHVDKEAKEVVVGAKASASDEPVSKPAGEGEKHPVSPIVSTQSHPTMAMALHSGTPATSFASNNIDTSGADTTGGQQLVLKSAAARCYSYPSRWRCIGGR